MNIRELCNYVPQRDAFLSIQTENNLVKQILPEYEDISGICVCIYGISEDIMDGCMEAVTQKAEEYKSKIKSFIPGDVMWDIMCKPVLLFDDKECATIFSDYANSLDVEGFASLIDSLANDYNIPWQHIKTIRKDSIYEIIDFYEGKMKDEQH